MTKPHSDGWAEVSPYLDEALELDPQQRETWLAALETTQPLLTAALRELLALHAANRASGFLERSPLRNEELLVGQQIGPYTIERLLGRGGMGSVWLARRSDGKFEGSVAIKLLDRRGLGRNAAEQIRHEASLLARLSHPHIARLFDAGVRDSGQPYLILEYVAGERIDHYCTMRQLPLAARLRLFLGVLDAVAHAHAQLIVHRDLKPSNVLVTPDEVVKLLDFGVAALQPLHEPEPGAPTEASQALTPGYAAPEQLRGEPVSAASDVYALGVLLYMLLTGQHPFGSGDATHTQLVRATLTEEPAPASGRIASAAEQRQVRGDLDAIIARALNAEPTRRYATATEFAADIRAFLGNFPVQARPATRAYVAHKFAQRHWGGILSVLLTLLVLIGATVITTLQLFEARRQRDFARSALARAEALNELNNYVLTDAAPAGKPFTVNDLLGRAAHLLERQHTNDANRVALLTSIGWSYNTQDEQQTGLRLLDKSYQLSRGVHDPSVRARAACSLADTLANHETSPRPEALLAEGLRELPAGAEFALDRSFCLLRGSFIAVDAGDLRRAIGRAQGAIEALNQVPFDHEVAELRAYADLGEVYRVAGRYPDAIAVFERIWPRLVALGRDDTITAVTWLNNWGLAAGQAGRPLEAERLLRRSIEIHRVDASDAAVSPMVMTNYAQQLFDLLRLDEARAYAETAYREGLRAGDDVVVNQTLLRLARIYRAQHEYVRASNMLDEVEPRLHKALPPGHYAFGSLALERALIAQEEGDTSHALALTNDGIDLLRKSANEGKTGAQHLPSLLSARASIETAAGQLPAAERDAREAVALLEAKARAEDFSSSTGRAYLTLARVLSEQGRAVEAHGVAQQAAEQLQKALGPQHPDTRAAEELSRAGSEAPSQ
jgi:serine/threonine-protein kinase